jgi:hypothetical protein
MGICERGKDIYKSDKKEYNYCVIFHNTALAESFEAL